VQKCLIRSNRKRRGNFGEEIDENTKPIIVSEKKP
jgi:hypothetical protein